MPLIIIIIIIKALLHWNSIIKYGGFFRPAYLEKACLLQYHESLLRPHKGESALWNLCEATEGRILWRRFIFSWEENIKG